MAIGIILVTEQDPGEISNSEILQYLGFDPVVKEREVKGESFIFTRKSNVTGAYYTFIEVLAERNHSPNLTVVLKDIGHRTGSDPVKVIGACLTDIAHNLPIRIQSANDVTPYVRGNLAAVVYRNAVEGFNEAVKKTRRELSKPC